MRCADCGKTVYSGSRACPWCGGEKFIEGKDPACGQVNSQGSDGWLRCADCGKTVYPGSKACPWCGSKNYRRADAYVPRRQPPKVAEKSIAHEAEPGWSLDAPEVKSAPAVTVPDTPPLGIGGSLTCSFCGKGVPKYSDACPWCGSAVQSSKKKDETSPPRALASASAAEPAGGFRLFSSSGRLGRMQFFYVMLFEAIAIFLLYIKKLALLPLMLLRHLRPSAFEFMAIDAVSGFVMGMLFLAVGIIAIIKRLHDFNKSGIHVIVLCIGMLGMLSLVLPARAHLFILPAIFAITGVLLFFKGNDTENQYGVRDGESHYWQIPFFLLGIPLAYMFIAGAIILVICMNML